MAKTMAYSYVVLVAFLMTSLPCMITAQSPSPTPAPMYYDMAPESYAPAPALDCMPYLFNLSDCLTFVEPGSNLTRPDPGCCPGLSNLVDTQPICLCQLLGNPQELGLPVDLNRALTLPRACNVDAPPVSLCAAIGIPVGALSPSGLSPTEGPSSDGSVAASPAPGNGSPSTLASNQHFFIGLAVVLSTYFL